jgi:hypothetical protein
VRDQDLGRGTRDARQAVVLRVPDPDVAEPLREPREVDRPPHGLRGARATDDRREVEDGQRQIHDPFILRCVRMTVSHRSPLFGRNGSVRWPDGQRDL